MVYSNRLLYILSIYISTFTCYTLYTLLYYTYTYTCYIYMYVGQKKRLLDELVLQAQELEVGYCYYYDNMCTSIVYA